MTTFHACKSDGSPIGEFTKSDFREKILSGNRRQKIFIGAKEWLTGRRLRSCAAKWVEHHFAGSGLYFIFRALRRLVDPGKILHQPEQLRSW